MSLRVLAGREVKNDATRTTQTTFLRDVATGSRRQGGQKRRYKDTLKKMSLRVLVGRGVKNDATRTL
ncbi:unnamed protein product [Schistocephalus solidus]|uniref:50S ribosomal protein L33 n=1 Tax=Schistocephalus solidus TaxID=70667 RepID=A0A183SCH2_SCHSO|nr:unnamed protein product [Schistocephalus solidus]